VELVARSINRQASVLDSAVRYLDIEVDDVLAVAEQIDV